MKDTFSSLLIFFKQKTAYELRISDWSSDVCSSDLRVRRAAGRRPRHTPTHAASRCCCAKGRLPASVAYGVTAKSSTTARRRVKMNPTPISANATLRTRRTQPSRSEEHRVGKEWGSQGSYRWAPAQ